MYVRLYVVHSWIEDMLGWEYGIICVLIPMDLVIYMINGTSIHILIKIDQE